MCALVCIVVEEREIEGRKEGRRRRRSRERYKVG